MRYLLTAAILASCQTGPMPADAPPIRGDAPPPPEPVCDGAAPVCPPGYTAGCTGPVYGGWYLAEYTDGIYGCELRGGRTRCVDGAPSCPSDEYRYPTCWRGREVAAPPEVSPWWCGL